MHRHRVYLALHGQLWCNDMVCSPGFFGRPQTREMTYIGIKKEAFVLFEVHNIVSWHNFTWNGLFMFVLKYYTISQRASMARHPEPGLQTMCSAGYADGHGHIADGHGWICAICRRRGTKDIQKPWVQSHVHDLHDLHDLHDVHDVHDVHCLRSVSWI